MKIIQVKVKPNARASSLVELDDGTWLAHVKVPPVDGRANDELVRLVAERLGLRRSQVSIRNGASSRLKRLQIEDA